MPDHAAATAAFWNDRWGTNQIGFHQATPDAQLVARWPALGLARQARVLVPLCGKSLDLSWLAARGHTVVGVELSPIAIAALFAERGATPKPRKRGAYIAWSAGPVTILEGSIFNLATAKLPAFDALWDRAALIALPPTHRDAYVAAVRRALSPASTGLLVSFAYDQTRRDGPPFSVPDAEVRRHYPGARALDRHALDDARFNDLGGVEEVVWRVVVSRG